MQVFFICVNTFFLSKEYYWGVLICGFVISYIWCTNVARVSVSTTSEKLIYSLGAAIGSVAGLFISTQIFKFFN
ncbi:MAG TPA: hypothetical protein PKD00_00120 [Burkholderiales bacterium]|nr:hypothetical protein [Burkholderiales bacterium]